VLHPSVVVSVGEVVSGMSTAGLLPVLSSIDSHFSLKEEVLKFESLDQVSVPDVSSVGNADMLVLLGDVVDLRAALLEEVLASEDSSVSLHDLLHGQSDLSSGLSSLRVSDSVKVSNGLLTSILGKFSLSLARLEGFNSGVSCPSAEDDEIKERVGTKSISTVNRCASDFTSSKETVNNLILSISTLGDDLSLPVSRDTTHVVVDSGNDRNGFFSYINTSENVGCLGNTWKSFLEGIGRKMVQVEVNVILLGANTSALNDFHGHGS